MLVEIYRATQNAEDDFKKRRSAIDSITQNEESKIDYHYVMMMRNNKFEHTVKEIETSNNAPLNYFFLLVLSYGISNLIHFITIP